MELEAKVDARMLALEEGVHEDEPELLFSGGKEEWQKFCETTLARDKKERDQSAKKLQKKPGLFLELLQTLNTKNMSCYIIRLYYQTLIIVR